MRFLFLIIFSVNTFAVMNKTVCANAITSALSAQNPGTDPNQIRPYWEIICEQIILTVKTATITNTGTSVVASGSSAGTWPVSSLGVIE